MRFLIILLLLPTLAFAGLPPPGSLDAPADARYCGEPRRNVDGRIIRSLTAKRNFVAVWACPSTGLHEISCPGWAIDHVIPLAKGGCDLAFNMQWLPNAIKSAAGRYPKDRWELCVYDPTHECLYGPF
jgi:hypothetical protein